MLVYNNYDREVNFVDDLINVSPPFRKIIERDKNEKKVNAKRDLLFVWYASDFASPGIKAGFDDDDLVLKGRKFCGYPEDWEPDDSIVNAINFYREHNPVEVVYAKDLLESLGSANKVVGVINTKMQSGLKKLDTLGDSDDDAAIRQKQIEYLTGDIKTLLSLAEKIPEAISLAKKAVATADDVNKTRRSVWGKRKLGNRETRQRVG